MIDKRTTTETVEITQERQWLVCDVCGHGVCEPDAPAGTRWPETPWGQFWTKGADYRRWVSSSSHMYGAKEFHGATCLILGTDDGRLDLCPACVAAVIEFIGDLRK